MQWQKNICFLHHPTNVNSELLHLIHYLSNYKHTQKNILLDAKNQYEDQCLKIIS